MTTQNDIRWPLQANAIRRGQMGTFGMVRNEGTKPHHGWDLYALPGTICYAVGDGEVVVAHYSNSYGNQVDIKLDATFQGTEIYARYAHLSLFVAALQRGSRVKKGQVIGFTGNTGNAKTMKNIDQHLHFEFLRRIDPRSSSDGLADRFDPADVYGVTPLGQTVFDPCFSMWEPNDGRTMPQRVVQG